MREAIQRPLVDRIVAVSDVGVVIAPSTKSIREILIINKTIEPVYVGGATAGQVVGTGLGGIKLAKEEESISVSVAYDRDAQPSVRVVCAAGKASVVYVIELE